MCAKISQIKLFEPGSKCPNATCQTISVSLKEAKGDRRIAFRSIAGTFELVDVSKIDKRLTYKSLKNHYMIGGIESSWKVIS